jgi:hypothetical protein
MKKTMMFLLCAHILASSNVMLASSADQQPPAQSMLGRFVGSITEPVIGYLAFALNAVARMPDGYNRERYEKQTQKKLDEDRDYHKKNPGDFSRSQEESRFFHVFLSLERQSNISHVVLPLGYNRTNPAIRNVYNDYTKENPTMEADRTLFILSHFNPNKSPKELEQIRLAMEVADATTSSTKQIKQ